MCPKRVAVLRKRRAVRSSFDEFIKRSGLNPNNRGGVPCFCCSLEPELRREIEGLRRRPIPVTFRSIAAYINDKKQTNISTSAVLGHFYKGHAK